MKFSLSLKLVFLIAGTILISSLVTIVLVNSYSSRRFKGYALQRDINIALTIAGYLTDAAEQGQLEEAVQSFSLIQNTPVPAMNRAPGMMGGGRMGMRQDEQRIAPVPFVIADESGRILRKNFPDVEDHKFHLSRETVSEGVLYYDQNHQPAGYVLAGSMIGGKLSENEAVYLKSLSSGILFSSFLALILACLIGLAALGRILKPLKSLNEGVRQLSRGNYSCQVENPGSGDEISQLAEGFNEMARSLQASEQWKKQIISDTAHELRTPVSLIMGNLEMMLEGVYQADETRLRSLYDESALLAELIQDLHELSSVESSMTSLEREPFEPDTLLRLSAEGFKAVSRDKDLKLVVEAGFGRSWNGDRRKIQQVIKNLLSNAVKFTPPRGTIFLRSYQLNRELVIEVEDTGPGIPEEERSRIFDRFYRMDRSRNRKDGGAGLGLAISKAIVELHNGTIGVYPGEKGGALFRIKLSI